MSDRCRRWIRLLCVAGVLPVLSCSSGQDSSTEPTVTEVTFDGTVHLPESSYLTYEDIALGFGERDVAVSTDGAFSIAGNQHLPGIAMARDLWGEPILMAVVPDPVEGLQVTVDVHSTALALAFLHPFVCSSNPDYAEEVVTDLESLSELGELESLLSEQLSGDVLALVYDNPDLEDALSRVVEAYVNSYPPTTSLLAVLPAHRSPSTPQDDDVQILPYGQVSGHQLNWKGGSSFEILNSYGRWAYCTTPSDSFFLWPNGDFLDLLKATQPWAPSTKSFTMSVPPNSDTQYVSVYGYGFSPMAGNDWDSLNATERLHANAAGIATIVVELCGQMLAVVTNTSRTLGNEEVASRLGGTIVGLLLSDGVLMSQVSAYIAVNDPWGLSWHLTKHVLSELTVNPSFRSAFVAATGMALTDGALSKLASWLSVPAKAVMTFNSVSSVMKTALGLSSARFKTSFAVWRDVIEYGSVRGQVADAEDGSPLTGAVVTLTGDENNPLNPDHEVTTGSDGYYRFDYIGAGPKSISASKSGYTPKAIGVVIETDAEITANITLQRGGAGVSGRVLNGIFVHHNIQSGLFSESLELVAIHAGGVEVNRYLYVNNGTYTMALPAGSWWIKAQYEDYKPDSFLVTVPGSGGVSAPRDLVLEPNPSMTGQIDIDMNNDGTFETSFEITFPSVGLTSPTLAPCAPGGNGANTMMGMAGQGTSYANFDFVYVGFSTTTITGPGVYPVGGLYPFGCLSGGTQTIGWLGTSRRQCNNPDGSGPMSFTIIGDPETPGCDCGISQPGNVFVTDWNSELGGLVAGGVTADLAGWANCHCSSSDEDGDGIDDDYDVTCARARLHLDFRFLVGTDYLVGWMPSTPPIP